MTMKYNRSVYMILIVCAAWLYAGFTVAAESAQFVDGARFVSKGTNYTVLENLMAIKVTLANSRSLEKIGVPENSVVVDTDSAYNNNLPQVQPETLVEKGTVVERKGNLEIRYKTNDNTPLNTDVSASDRDQSTGLAVVRNDNTGELGVVLGNINAQIKDGYDPKTIAKRHDIRLLGYASGPRIAFFQVSKNMAILISALTSLQSDAGVEHASIEIVEHFPKSQ